MPRKLTSATTLDNLRKEARRWLKALRQDNAEARERLQRAYPKASGRPVLRDVQHALALEFGLKNWIELRLALQRQAAPADAADSHTFGKYDRAAQDFLNAYEGDAAALQRLNEHYRRAFNLEDLNAEIWRRVYAFRQRAFKGTKNYLQLAEAQLI